MFDRPTAITSLALLLIGPPSFAAAQGQQNNRAAEVYESASVDSSGRLAIMTADQRAVLIGAADERFCRTKVALSPDRSSVAAVACERDMVPLHMVVYTAGKVHRFRGTLPIFNWAFSAGGRRVAFDREPFQGACWVAYELWDIATERLVDSFELHVSEVRTGPCGHPEHGPAPIPSWVADLRSRTK